MMLAEPRQTLAIDEDRLAALLDTAVSTTKGYTVERLEQLSSRISQCIYHHRLAYDKTELLDVSICCLVTYMYKIHCMYIYCTWLAYLNINLSLFS